jgi:cobalt-zinc-cadmium efflux system outer membrane protein
MTTMIRSLFITVFLSATHSIFAAAYSPEAAAAHAVRHNPSLVAARHRVAEAEGRLMHSGRLASPEVEIEVKPNLEGGEFGAGVGLMQKVPVAPRRRLEKSVSAAELEVIKYEVREAERLLASQVRVVAVRWLDLRARRDLQQRRAEHSRQLAAAAGRAAAVGEASALAAGEMELATSEVELKLLQLEAEEEALAGSLRALMGLAPGAPVAVTGSLADPKAGNSSAALDTERHAAFQVAQARIAAAKENIDLQRASKWEDVSVGFGYEREQAEDAGYGLRRDNFLGLKLSIPLPLGANNLSHIREAEAVARRREAEADSVAAILRAEVASARAEMKAAARVHALAAGDSLAKARRLEENQMAAYQAGQSALTDVLRSRERRFALEAASLEARRDYHLARIRLETALGQ